MKKMVRLLSVLMVVVMMFSMSTSAFAMVKGNNQGTAIVVGGNTASGATVGGNLKIGGDTRPFDDKPNGAFNGTDTGLERTDDEQYVKKYAGDGDYSSIENSDDPNVILNEDFLKCVHDNYDDPSIVSEGTLNFAVGFFGEEIVYGEEVVENAVQESQETVTELPAPSEEETVVELPQESQQDPIVIGGDIPSAQEPEEPEAVEEEEAPVENNVKQSPAENEQEAPTENTEQPPVENNAEQLSAGRKVVHAVAVAAVPDLDPKSVLRSGLSSQLTGGEYKLTKPFDICNSTDYKVTIDLNGTTIKSPEDGYAFVVQNGYYGSSVSFTNGTINGDGFYVTGNGILNLGGWINRTTGIDITVNAKSNAIYVGEGGTAVIGQGTQLTTKGIPSAHKGTIYVAPGGQARMTGGHVFGATGFEAVVNEGYFLLNSTGDDLNSSYGVIHNDYGVAMACTGNDTDSGKTEIVAGTVIGQTGIAVNYLHKLYMYGGTVTGTGVPAKVWGDTGNTGSAIVVAGRSDDKVNDKATGLPTVTVSGGALRSQQTAAIINLDKTGEYRIPEDLRTNITNITLSSASIITQQVGDSDYKVAKYTVNGIGYGSLDEALAATKAGTNQTYNVKMGADDEVSTAPTIEAGANTVTFDGNGHELVVNGANGFTVNSGNVTIRNVVLTGNRTNTSGIVVNGGNAYLGDAVTIRLFNNNGVNTANANANVTINDIYITESVGTGIYAEKGKTTVIMVKDDCFTPVLSDSAAKLEIRGGWFLYNAAKDDKDNAWKKVATYVDAKTSNVQYVTVDKYYEVLYNTTPTVEIVSAEAYSNEGETPYVVYDKSNATPVVFKVNPELIKITAVGKDASKGSYPIYATEGKGVTGNVRIADNEVLMNCPSGAYDLQFTFANGYVLKNKLSLYVYPRYIGMFEVPNTNKVSSVKKNFDELLKYLDPKYAVETYDVASGNNFAVVMSELPDKLAIGTDPNGIDVIYLENFMADKAGTSYYKIPSGTYAGDYLYFLSYADLNNLAAGKNYAFMVFDDIMDETGDGAIQSYPFTVKNTAVSISPDTVMWNKAVEYTSFTVKPDVLDYQSSNPNSVYIDGEKVDKAYWKYDNEKHVLSIKSSYLSALDKKDHTLEVLTTMGKVSASISTKTNLMPKNLDYHVYGGAKSLTFVASDKINKDKGVWIGSSNPTKLDPSCYVWNSDTEFTLSSAFLNRLTYGTYYISVYVGDGTNDEYVTTSFKVISAAQASYNPSTGDNSKIFIWVIVLALSAVAIVVILLPRLKNSKKTDTAGKAKK